MIERGIPEHIRSDNGTKLVVKNLSQWPANMAAKIQRIEAGSLWENRLLRIVQQ
jgi:putative transposase